MVNTLSVHAQSNLNTLYLYCKMYMAAHSELSVDRQLSMHTVVAILLKLLVTFQDTYILIQIINNILFRRQCLDCTGVKWQAVNVTFVT